MMLVVPVAGDVVSLMSTPGEWKVSSYTSLKPEPAIYLTEPLESGDRSVFLADVTALNGVIVEQADGLLKAVGSIKRKYNLPQPGDVITTALIETAFKEEAIELEVSEIGFTGKEPHTLVIHCGTTKLNLADIVNLKRKRGFEKFNRAAFLKYYLDYCPLGVKL